jgi:Na+(H+)/acetate symporter ActP
MNLMLAAMFVAVVLGLFWSDYGPRQRAMVAALSISVTTLYYVFAGRLM